MPRITFVAADGTRHTVSAAVGASAMDAALDNGVPGILAQCGGACTCGTCHCYVGAWAQRLAPAQPDELELLEYLPLRQPDSRLACQIRLEAACEGLVLRLPVRQT